MTIRRRAVSGLGTLFVVLSGIASAGELYFPPYDGAWEAVSPDAAGWNVAALEDALSYAQSENASGVVILQDGRILAERYWPVESPSRGYANFRVGETADGHPIEDVASVQKSVVAVLAAMVKDRGQLNYDDRVRRYLGVEWSMMHQDREGDITVRHLMSMTSGMTPRFTYAAQAGTQWRYNTRAYAKLHEVLEDATGKDIGTLTRGWLVEPLGMSNTSWKKRDWVRNADAANQGLVTTARDLARFGLFVLADGTWNGEQLVSDPGLLHELTMPSQDLNPAYGLLWWINGQDRFLRPSGDAMDGPLIPSAPDDLVSASGALDRRCYVVPSRNLVVVRLGDAASPMFDRMLWRRLTPAIPQTASK